jgi:hypothetical protein
MATVIVTKRYVVELDGVRVGGIKPPVFANKPDAYRYVRQRVGSVRFKIRYRTVWPRCWSVGRN